MNATASRSIAYSFGPGQAEGINNVTVNVTVDIENPLDGTITHTTTPVTVQLPAAGWDEGDVLMALQEKFPAATIAWEVPPAE